MRITFSLFVALGFVSIGLISQGCAAPTPEETEARGETVSNVEAARPADICGVAASQARAKATFERTTSCALDAATAGVGDKLKLAGEVMGDIKTMGVAVRRIAATLKVTNLNTAKAVMCVRSLGGYGVDAATKEYFTALAVGLDAAEVDSLYDNAAGFVTVGVSDIFKAYGEVEKNPTAANITSFLTSLSGSFATVAGFVTSCATVFQPIASGVAIPTLGKYSARFASIGAIGSIINCSSTLIQNSVDVGTELFCLGEDYKRIAEQTAAIRRATDRLCSSFATYTANPATRPIVQSGQDKAMCAEIVRHWGYCVADAKRDGFFGEKALTCDECRTVCNGYVNSAGANAYLEPVLAGAYSKTGGAKRQDVQNLVMEAGTCVYGTPDDKQPCINTCLGRNANTECAAR